MKECPKCRTIYTDVTLSFCLSDGTPLVAAEDEQATFVRRSDEPIRVDIGTPSTAQFAEPPQFTRPSPPTSSGVVFKVLVAAAVVLVLLLAVLGVVGTLVYYNGVGKQAAANTVATPTPARLAGPADTPASTPLDQHLPTPTPWVAADDPDTPEIDKEALKAEVIEVEKEVIRAAIRGDTASLAENLTDDFVSIDPDGKRYNKKAMINEIKNSTYESSTPYSFGKVELISADEDTVVIRYILTLSPPASEPDRTQLTETYVNQDGRWRLKVQKSVLK
ncbi:MAG: nuclear transport factor 2 family protein [Pyrinomonadaceae bacterium]|nr:nuclear transport factor 2 family protein [Pyrinomonadaceae bacterium]